MNTTPKGIEIVTGNTGYKKNLNGCDSNKLEYCIYFPDIRWIYFKVKEEITTTQPLTDIAETILLASIPISIPPVDTTFKSYVW